MSPQFPSSFPRLYPILDFGCVFPGLPPHPEVRRVRLQQLVRELSDAGVELLQYRNKLDPDDTVLADARAMREAAPQITLILNDRAALVQPAGWDGVHIGQDDLDANEARRTLGPDAIIGLSTHTGDQVRQAGRQPVDYIAVGPVFKTASKQDTSPVIGVEGVARARSLTRKPLVVIGGINLENARAVYQAGADSVAVIAAIFAPGRSSAHSARDFLDIFK